MAGKTVTWRGQLVRASNGEEDDLLGLVREDNFRTIVLVEDIQAEMAWGMKFLSVRYFITDQPCPEEKLNEELLKTLYGVGSVDYAMRYSDYTGYLWTDEECNVGGHDLKAELVSCLGKYVHLEITFSEKAKKQQEAHGNQ